MAPEYVAAARVNGDDEWVLRAGTGEVVGSVRDINEVAVCQLNLSTYVQP